MQNSELKWGSDEWRTHLRRSLAQRKRHGEDIKDIEGLIDYIEAKGPSKGKEDLKEKISSPARKPHPRQRSTKNIVRATGQKIIHAPSGQTTPNENGLFSGVTVIKRK